MISGEGKALVAIREFIGSDIYGMSSTDMSVSPQPEAIEFHVSLWRLRAARAIALCSRLAILVPWYAAIFRDFSRRQDRIELLMPILFFPLWLPYAWVVWGLRSNPLRARSRTL